MERDENELQAEAQIEGFRALGRALDGYDVPEDEDEETSHIDELTETEREGVLEIAVERTVRIVLCTGGPHAEIRWPERGNPTIVCYGWFGSDRFERELTSEEIAGVEYALGDWETLAGDDS